MSVMNPNADHAALPSDSPAHRVKNWLADSAAAKFPAGVVKELSSRDLAEFFSAALAAPLGAHRNRKLQLLCRELPGGLLQQFLLTLGDSSIREDSDLARDTVFARSHELSSEELLVLGANSVNDLIKESAVAAAAKRYLDTGSLQEGLNWAAQKSVIGLTSQIVESVSLGARWNELLDQPKESSWWTPELVAAVSRNFGRLHPEQTKSWIEDWGNTNLGQKPLVAFVESWLNEEPLLASEWVRSLGQGDQRDSAAAAVARYAVREGDLPTARQWVKTINEPELRAATSEFIDRR